MDNKIKKIIVTGGSKGMGKGIATILLESGYQVHICARNKQLLKHTVAELSPLGSIDFSIFDLSNNWQEPLYGIGE